MKYRLTTWCTVCKREIIILVDSPDEDLEPIYECMYHKADPTPLEIRSIEDISESEADESSLSN